MKYLTVHYVPASSVWQHETFIILYWIFLLFKLLFRLKKQMKDNTLKLQLTLLYTD